MAKQVSKGKKSVPKMKVIKPIEDGLDQTFTLRNGKQTTIRKFLKPSDTWKTKGRVERVILKHDAVKKIADGAGLSKDVKYAILTQPDAMNNYQYTIEARVCYIKGGECASEVGEANRSNLGNKGRNNPANMAQKRAYDRAVFRLLGITGLLSEEELEDEEQEEHMDPLSHDERRQVAPLINKLLLAKTKADLILFDREMKKDFKKYSEVQLDYIRGLYKKTVGLLSKTAF